MEKLSSEQSETSDRVLEFDLSAELRHGIAVSNLAYALSKELGLPHEQCYDLAIEELKYVRMHSTLGYEELKDQGYSDFVLESILYHHENYDGSGYPSNLAGKEIPIGARILRVCDVFCALSQERSYRKAFDKHTVMELMIDEIKNFDLEVFLAFQRVVHASQAGK